jgi:Domain of unknown function (DUF4345)
MATGNSALRAFLSLAGLFILFVGFFHAFVGVRGDWIIGLVPPDTIDASLDSQNRFYGAAFLLHGVLLIYCARDVIRFENILRILFAVMFFAGCVRGLAVLANGWPTLMVSALGLSEILLPPIAWFWLNNTLDRAVMPKSG